MQAIVWRGVVVCKTLMLAVLTMTHTTHLLHHACALVCSRGEYDLGAQHAHDLSTFNRKGFRHHNNAIVTLLMNARRHTTPHHTTPQRDGRRCARQHNNGIEMLRAALETLLVCTQSPSLLAGSGETHSTTVEHHSSSSSYPSLSLSLARAHTHTLLPPSLAFTLSLSRARSRSLALDALGGGRHRYAPLQRRPLQSQSQCCQRWPLTNERGRTGGW